MMDDAESARLGMATLAAAVAAPAPLVLTMLGGASSGVVLPFVFVLLAMVIGFLIALLHVVVFALPAYLLLSRRWRLSWWNAGLAGLLIGALPMALLSMSWSAGLFGAPSGLFGGLAFWAVLATGERGDPPPDRRNDLDGIFA